MSAAPSGGGGGGGGGPCPCSHRPQLFIGELGYKSEAELATRLAELASRLARLAEKGSTVYC